VSLISQINYNTTNDVNTSNYVELTSNIISKRINELTTDMIIQEPDAVNKFIINNTYNNNLEINGNLLLQSNLNINGDVNLKGNIYKDGFLFQQGSTSYNNATVLHKYSPIQTHYNIYKKTEEKTKPGWQFVDESIDSKIYLNSEYEDSDTIDGFCIRIKPHYSTTKILINLNCHISIDNGQNYPPGDTPGNDARAWGLRLYRKIGVYGEWEHLSDADGDILSIPGITGIAPTPCWISHNLGVVFDNLTGLSMANMSGTYYDESIISYDYIYYTAKWCSVLGIDNIDDIDLYNENNNYNGKLYLNRPAIIFSEYTASDNGMLGYLNSAVVSSSWNVTEIWQQDAANFPRGGVIVKYAPMQTEVNIYTKTFEKMLPGWEFIGCNTDEEGNAIIAIDNNSIKEDFCVRIKPNHYSSKILIKLDCKIGIGGDDAAWWGMRLYRRIGEEGEWEHISDADGDILKDANGNILGTSCWITNNLGAYNGSGAAAQTIASVSGVYYDTPNAGSEAGVDSYVYYAAKWSSFLGDDNILGGKLFLNRPYIIYDDLNENGNNEYLNTQLVSSSWNVTEIWQHETTFIPSNVIISNNMSIQTLFNIYRDTVSKSGNGWQFIDNNIKIIKNKIEGFCIRIKLSHATSKVLLNLFCHIGIDYGTNARWWGIRLYRKIGKNGEWMHLSDADGVINNNGTSCWLSHNLGAETSISSYSVANISGSYYDAPGTSSDYIYYTVKWCAMLGDNTTDSKLYLNRPASYNNNNNSASLSSSWCAQEIWQLGTPFEPSVEANSILKIFNSDTIGIGIGNTTAIYKLDVNGVINANKYYTIDPIKIQSAPLINSLEKINSINPISYLRYDQLDGDVENYGFDAEELGEKIPGIVNYIASTQKYTIEYMSIVPLLTRSIQELSEKIREQEEVILSLKEKLDVFTFAWE
jgi:hypothetical protein